MLHFLRHIRQKLILQENVRKYLLYAVGEILLVVIGILIALQINNWNESRKLVASETEILQNLHIELTNIQQEFTFYRKQHRMEYEAGIWLASHFNTDISEIPVDTLHHKLALLEAYWTFEPNDGYIKSLITSGKIDHIQNVEIKSLITSFEGLYIDATQEAEPAQRLLDERLWPLIDGKINALDRLKTLDFYDDFPAGTYESDYEWFFSNREIEDIVVNITVWKENLMEDEEEFKNKIDDMIRLIGMELEN